MEFPLIGKAWNRRSFLKGLGASALAMVGLASPPPLRRSFAAGATAKDEGGCAYPSG
jgi:hypothetical protein